MSADLIFQGAAAFAAREGLRLWPVVGDAMVPSLRPGDYLLVEPVEEYVGEGIYVVGIADPTICRASQRGSGMIRLWHDNRRQGEVGVVTIEWFRANALARAVYAVNRM